MQYFEDLITNLSMKEEHSFSTTVDKRNKSTGYKKRSSKAKKPVTARSRGVILPGHLKVCSLMVFVTAEPTYICILSSINLV